MRSRNLLAGIVVSVFMGVLLSAAFVSAGGLEPIAGPNAPGSQMHTLDEIYFRIAFGPEVFGPKMPAFSEPSNGPTAGTKHTLDEIYDMIGFRAPVAKTGQIVKYAIQGGDDGDLRKGVAWPIPRFSVNNDGTVTDNLTGLVWLQKVDCLWPKNRSDAVSAVNALKSGPLCGLTDGSVAGNWRLPNARELHSLVDFAYSGPALSNASGTGQYNGDTFTGAAVAGYWSSTTYAGDATVAWFLSFDSGMLILDQKVNLHGVMAVRAPGA